MAGAVLPVVLSGLEKSLPREAELLRHADFASKRTLVIGATGGIGTAAVEIVSALGSKARNLILTYNSNRGKAEELARGAGAISSQYTHSTPESAMAFVSKLPDSIDYVLDASGLPGHATLARLTKEPGQVYAAFAANTFGPFFMIAQLLTSGKLNTGAQVAYVSTIAVDGNRGQAHYAASKAAIGAAISAWVCEPAVTEQGIGLKVLELSVVQTGTRDVELFMRRVRTAESAHPGVKRALEEAALLMSPAEAAYRSLAALADAQSTGRVRIPVNASVEKIQRIIADQTSPAGNY